MDLRSMGEVAGTAEGASAAWRGDRTVGINSHPQTDPSTSSLNQKESLLLNHKESFRVLKKKKKKVVHHKECKLK